MGLTPSHLDRRLLDLVQRGVPLVRRPYAQVAQELGAGEEEVIARLAELGAPGGVVREIAGVFDAGSLGFASTLAAGRCPPERLDECGATAAAHPGVSHCYGRGGELNLWFTLVVPPDSALGLSGTLTVLAQRMRVERILSLPTLRRYKLEVLFDQAEPDPWGRPSGAPATPLAPAPAAPASRPTAEQIRAIQALQTPLPAVPEPFDALAAAVGLSGDDLLVHAVDLLSAGWMRRYAAVLRHRQAGAVVNVMVAWAVPPEQADRFGQAAAEVRAVSHCYLRPSAPDWPYNLYTMLHGRSNADVAAAIAQLASAARSNSPISDEFPRASLPALREYKKAKVRLFSPDLARWEAQVT